MIFRESSNLVSRSIKQDSICFRNFISFGNTWSWFNEWNSLWFASHRSKRYLYESLQYWCQLVGKFYFTKLFQWPLLFIFFEGFSGYSWAASVLQFFPFCLRYSCSLSVLPAPARPVAVSSTQNALLSADSTLPNAWVPTSFVYSLYTRTRTYTYLFA